MKPILTAGDIEIFRIEEHRSAGLPIAEMFLDSDRLHQQIAQLGPDDYEPTSDRVVMSYSSYVVRSDGLVVVVDTGIGNGKSRRRDMWNELATTWLDDLSSVVEPDEVNIVVCTHLHCDHVGWNTRRDDDDQWVPTFPNARYLFNEFELSFIMSDAAQTMFERNGDFYLDSIKPVFDAGRADIVELPHEVCTGIVLEHAPGDTPGHMIVRVRSPRTFEMLALISGDVLHHVLQVETPELTSSFCSMKEVSEATRRRLLAECADSGVPMLPGHVASHDLLYIARATSGSFEIAS